MIKKIEMPDIRGVIMIPFWKAVRVAIPDDMQILHARDFDPTVLLDYDDEPFFRLYHDLLSVDMPVLPQGYCFVVATFADFADHIRKCYPSAAITADDLRAYKDHPVYDARLWVAIAQDDTGDIVATGIAELDPAVQEGILEWIQVSPMHRRLGLGSCIVNTLLIRIRENAKFATVSGRCSNPTNPESLYRSCGFTGEDIWHILRCKDKMAGR